MQNHVLNDNLNSLNKNSLNPLMKQALGVTSPYSAGSDLEISQKQIEILEDAIKRYERLEDIKKFSKIALNDIETVTEDEIKRAIELENTVSIDNELAVLNLIQNEGFLNDLESADFSEILSADSDSLENTDKLEFSETAEFEETDFLDFNQNSLEDFISSDFDPSDFLA